MVEEIKLDKTRFLELLEKEPKYTEEGTFPDNKDFLEVREKWGEDIKSAFYEDVLQIYEEDEHLLEEIGALKEELIACKKILKSHVHLGNKVCVAID